MPTISRTELHHLIDELPEPVLPEIAQFVKFIQFKLDENLPETYTPIALGGLWQGLTISDEDIVTVRQEMWAKFGDVAE